MPTSNPNSLQGIMNLKQKQQLLRYRQQNPGVTQSQLARYAKEQFNLRGLPNQSTISRLIKDKDKFEHIDPRDQHLRHSRVLPYAQIDNAVAEWVHWCEAQNLKVGGTMIQQKAKEIRNVLNLTDEDIMFGAGWLDRFKKRHGFKLRKKREKGDVEMSPDKPEPTNEELLELAKVSMVHHREDDEEGEARDADVTMSCDNDVQEGDTRMETDHDEDLEDSDDGSTKERSVLPPLKEQISIIKAAMVIMSLEDDITPYLGLRAKLLSLEKEERQRHSEKITPRKK